jgi:hypothetical protein
MPQGLQLDGTIKTRRNEMNITIEKLQQLEVAPEVEQFMRGMSNHQKIVDYWSENPDASFAVEYSTLIQCLAYSVQQPNPSVHVTMRLLGRTRAIRQLKETQEIQDFVETKKLLG